MFNPLGMSHREQFVTQHGEYVKLEDGRFLFQDGAWCESSPMGIMAEPPEDATQLAKLMVQFWSAKLSRAVSRFEQLRDQLHNAALAAKQSGYSPPGEEELAPLLELQKTVKGLQKKVANAKADVEASPAQQRCESMPPNGLAMPRPPTTLSAKSSQSGSKRSFQSSTIRSNDMRLQFERRTAPSGPSKVGP